MKEHWAIFVNNNSNKKALIHKLLSGDVPSPLKKLKTKKGGLFSKLALDKFLKEEDRHGKNRLEQGFNQALKTMSSGEQKKALLHYLLRTTYDFIILDNPFDNLDHDSQIEFIKRVEAQAQETTFIQILSRESEVLPFITNYADLNGTLLSFRESTLLTPSKIKHPFTGKIPKPLEPSPPLNQLLIHLSDVSVRFGNKIVLKHIDWKIHKGEFWQLSGKNGSGKSTLLAMITGENPKGYGQELFLFGKKKGSGESIWDIKKNIGYFSPAMTYKFNGRHSVEHMLISGLNDSIGLYLKPTESQLALAKKWMLLLGFLDLKNELFCNLTMGQQRLIMIARAMVKHPPLLLLDEPTAGLDDQSVDLLVNLVNKIAKESHTAIIFVSHRVEQGLNPDYIYELQMTASGSIGKIL